MGISEIITEAMRLKPQERYLIIEELVHSLDEPNKEIDNLWLQESIKRLAAYKSSSLKTVSYETVFGSAKN